MALLLDLDRQLVALVDTVARHGRFARMGARAEELMDEVLALPEDERRECAQALLHKLAADPDVLEAWYDEAERRWGEIERGEVETLSWDEVRERVFGAR